MTKEKRILSYFIGWLIIGFLICFMGINNVFAATYYMNYQYQQQYYNNNGSSVSSVTTTWMDSFNSYVSGNIPTTAKSYGAGLSISSPIPLISNHTYTLSFYFEDTNNIALSSKNNIAIGNDLFGASYNYAHNDFWADTVSSKVNNNTVLQFVFTAKGPATHIFIPWTTTTTTTQDYVLTEIIMEDLGSEGISQSDINNSLNNQTNELNNSINNSTNKITGSITDSENNINNNIDDMEQAIVDSNKETQEVIKDQFNSCRDSYNLLNSSNTTIVKNQNGEDRSGYYVQIKETGNYYLLLNTSNTMYFGKSNSLTNVTTLIGSTSSTYSTNYRFNTGEYFVIWGTKSDTDKLMVTLASNGTNYEAYGEEICSNKIDETNDKLDNLQGALTDDSSPNIDGLTDSAGWLPPGPLDSVLNLPLSLFNALTTNLGKSCTSISLPLPFVDTNLQLPCISTLYNKIGISSFISWIGVIVSGFMLYTYLLKLYKWIEDRISLNETHSVDNWGGL